MGLDLLYKDLTHQILGCAFSAFRKVGVGFDEIRYHKLFHHYLIQNGLNANYKVPFQLNYLGHKIADIEVDEIIENKIIIELKCIQSQFLPENIAQIINYLKICRIRLGVLINFGLNRLFQKRIIFDDIRKANVEYWDKGPCENRIKDLYSSLIKSIHNIEKNLGVGYHSRIYWSAFKIELNQANISYNDNVYINEKIENIAFSPFRVNDFLIENCILVGILAGKSSPRIYDIVRMRNYMRRLKLNHGLIVYWSTKNLQTYGLYEP